MAVGFSAEARRTRRKRGERLFALALFAISGATAQVHWKDALSQPAAWYGSAEAVRIAENLLVYQQATGAWDKNIDMSAAPAPGKAAGMSTIDNGATYTQMEYLARAHRATGNAKYAAAFRRGLKYLLKAQYPNGGWPQFYPLRNGYWDHITYNDDAMVGVMTLLRGIVRRRPEYSFMNDEERTRAKKAMDRGIEVILKTQVVQNGTLTVWCAQHDEKTLAPAKARSYELPSLSGSESVGIVEFLMGIEKPSPEVVKSVKAAVAWFERSKITGIRVVVKDGDRVVVEDPQAPPLWARFYELGTNRPFFCGRDGVVKYRLSEIEAERRNHYNWYVDRPAKLLREDYPKWVGLL
jgi:PelA/Pel-15E family pectate lyase